MPSHLAIEPARFALRHGQRNAVGRGSRSEAETLSPAREARDRALRVPCFSPRERDRDGRRGCSDGDSTESPRSLRCAHDDEIYTRGLRGRPQDRGSIRRTAYMLAHRGDHAGGKRIILVSNGAKLEWPRRGSDCKDGSGGGILTTDLWVMSSKGNLYEKTHTRTADT